MFCDPTVLASEGTHQPPTTNHQRPTTTVHHPPIAYLPAYFNRAVAHKELGQWEEVVADCTATLRIHRLHQASGSTSPSGSVRITKLAGHLAGPFNGPFNGIADDEDGAEAEVSVGAGADGEGTSGRDAVCDMWLMRATAFNQLHQYQRAVEDATAAVRIDPLSIRAYQTRAFAYTELGEWLKALYDLDQVVRLTSTGANIARRGQGDEGQSLDPRHAFAARARYLVLVKLQQQVMEVEGSDEEATEEEEEVVDEEDDEARVEQASPTVVEAISTPSVVPIEGIGSTSAPVILGVAPSVAEIAGVGEVAGVAQTTSTTPHPKRARSVSEDYSHDIHAFTTSLPPKRRRHKSRQVGCI